MIVVFAIPPKASEAVDKPADANSLRPAFKSPTSVQEDQSYCSLAAVKDGPGVFV